MWSYFWPLSSSPSAAVVEKMEAFKVVESKLLTFAKRFGDNDNKGLRTSSISTSSSSTGEGTDNPDQHDLLQINIHQTSIPKSSVPVYRHGCLLRGEQVDDDTGDYVINGVHVVSSSSRSSNSEEKEAPLVLLHGYMNGAAYFYRNFAGLSRYFPQIYSLDWLGAGLSSRPSHMFDDNTHFDGNDHVVRQTEDVFCESLEAWRKQNKIEQMTLAGHSMGGYLSVAYCERYPERVKQLVLLSPVGVPDIPPPTWEERRKHQSFSAKMIFGAFHTLFENQFTPGILLRNLPKDRSMQFAHSYVTKRLPAITDPEEQNVLADYLWYNAVLPGSAEYCIGRILTSPYLIAKRPLLHRIPALQVPNVSFLYGSHDWMDVTGGLKAQLLTEQLQQQGQTTPTVSVYRINEAGHLLMLDNYEGVNNGIALATGVLLDETLNRQNNNNNNNRNASSSLKDITKPVKLCPRTDMPNAHNVFGDVSGRSASSPPMRVPTASPPTTAAQA